MKYSITNTDDINVDIHASHHSNGNDRKDESRVKRFRNVFKKRIREAIVRNCGCVGLTLISLFLFSVVFILPLANIIAGAIFKNDCPIDRRIPVWLVVEGAVCAFLFVISLVDCASNKVKSVRLVIQIVKWLVFLFLISWQVTGCIWIFEIRYKVWYNYQFPWRYCHEFLYIYSYVVLIQRWFQLLIYFLLYL